MSARLGGIKTCDNTCGCPSPCPGGLACRCTSNDATASGEEHRKCSCGEHCGCNPCTCSKNTATTTAGVGKAYCKCGTGCTCVTCGA